MGQLEEKQLDNKGSEADAPKVDAGVWKRMMRNYAMAMVIGVAMLAYLMPNLHNDASAPMLAAVFVGGLMLFCGGFGVVVSLFFHYINRAKA